LAIDKLISLPCTHQRSKLLDKSSFFKVQLSHQYSAGLTRACVIAFTANLHLHKIKLLTDSPEPETHLPTSHTISQRGHESAKALSPASSPPKDVGGWSQQVRLSQEMRRPWIPSTHSFLRDARTQRFSLMSTHMARLLPWLMASCLRNGNLRELMTHPQTRIVPLPPIFPQSNPWHSLDRSQACRR
jgi:hypothetical protein